MNPVTKKVLIAAGIIAGMVIVVFATAFVVFLIISGTADEFSRA